MPGICEPVNGDDGAGSTSDSASERPWHDELWHEWSEGALQASEDDSDADDDRSANCSKVLLVFFLTFLSTALLDCCTVLLTSSMTPYGIRFYDAITMERNTMVAKYLRRFSFSGGGLCLLIVYLFDLWKLNQGCLRIMFKAFMVFAILIFGLGILFATPKFPWIPLAYGILFVMVTTNLLKFYIFGKRRMGISSHLILEGVALAYFLMFILLSALWITWLSTGRAWDWSDHPTVMDWLADTSEGIHGIPDQGMPPEGIPKDQRRMIMQAAWILWCSPEALALAHLIMACFVWMHGRFKMHHKNTNGGVLDLGIEVKISVMLLAFLMIGAYLAACLGATDDTIGQLVLNYFGVTFLLVFMYLAKWVGLRRLESMANESSAMQTAAAIVTNDWVKALVVLIGPPLFLGIILVESCHERCRRCLQSCKLLDPVDDKSERRYPFVTSEASWLLDESRLVLFRDTTQIVTKAIYAAIAIVMIMVCVSTAIPIFLSWVNHHMEGISIFLCLVVVASVVVGLFLIPPITGQVIYGFAATVVVPKFGYKDGFWTGIAVSSALCLACKLIATGIEMKAIGLPGSSSVAVKRFIGVHTPFMKALRYVLTRPGCSAGKTAILTFGPDFPTSVLTGVLDLPLVPMLLGTLPVVLVIAPCCIAFAYLTDKDEENKSQHESIAAVNLILSGVLGAAGNGLIAYYVQIALSENHDQLEDPDSHWMADPLEDEVLESLEEQRQEAKEWAAKTNWGTLPCAIRLCLCVGSGLSTITVYTLMQPIDRAFVKFGLGDSIEKLPGGNALGAVNPVGWLVLGLTAVLIFLVAIFNCWGNRCAEK